MLLADPPVDALAEQVGVPVVAGVPLDHVHEQLARRDLLTFGVAACEVKIVVAVVACLVLCSVPDQQAALSEIRRVLRPGGQFRYFEHVVSGRRALARLERLLDTMLYPLLARGCHCSRDTGAAIRQAGFQIKQEARIAVRDAQLGPSVQHILGTARRA